MDSDIQFGEVQEAGREVQLRPDQNRHYAVVPVHSPEDADLPIYVDIDVMRDMETHALTDTSVELGGVMLGGQYEDEEGNPFVVVTDSLRAAHYEATKGSFKFTHDTWQQISRQRDEFPDELQMVGWYHTHPDWGVFLSGMDMFICDNFFNRPLDLALVIDPCRGDRGWFHWNPASKERIRRTGGFYLIGSRFRQSEIDYFAFQLKGKLNMAADYQNTGIAGSIGPQAAPVVNISDSRDPQMNNGILGLLAMQFLFLAIISWKLLFSGPADSDLTEIKDQIAAISSESSSAQKIKVLERALQLSGPEKAEIAKLMQENQKLTIQLEDSMSKRVSATDENKTLNITIASLKADRKSMQSRLDEKRDEARDLRAKAADLTKENEALKEGGDSATKPFWANGTLLMVSGAFGLITFVIGGFTGVLLWRLREKEVYDEEVATSFEIEADDQDGSKEMFPASEQPDKENGSPDPNFDESNK